MNEVIKTLENGEKHDIKDWRLDTSTMELLGCVVKEDQVSEIKTAHAFASLNLALQSMKLVILKDIHTLLTGKIEITDICLQAQKIINKSANEIERYQKGLV